ncbi:uncharacterized protein LOC114461402 [Gouania willdenowi]|uniref:uncharacterized protein LOC114461402 n=1 Tax=Gouania willdenowi TaxID=441366 RepID=UPI001055847B|nr:uncharacterized protein LOC114461402 [Gouania willdenowi]
MAEQQPSASKKLPIPPLALTAYTAKTSIKKWRQEERKAKKKVLDRARDKSRINIGVDFQRWRELRDLKGLKTDAELATFLLDGYEKNPSSFQLPKRRQEKPPPQHVSTIVSESLVDRDHNTTDEEDASDAAFNHKVHSNSSKGSSSGNTEHLYIKDIISVVVVKSEDDEEKPVTQLTEVNVKEEPQTCSSADVIKKEEPEDNYEQQTETS